jgi:hypothetical protein
MHNTDYVSWKGKKIKWARKEKKCERKREGGGREHGSYDGIRYPPKIKVTNMCEEYRMEEIITFLDGEGGYTVVC